MLGGKLQVCALDELSRMLSLCRTSIGRSADQKGGEGSSQKKAEVFSMPSVTAVALHGLVALGSNKTQTSFSPRYYMLGCKPQVSALNGLSNMTSLCRTTTGRKKHAEQEQHGQLRAPCIHLCVFKSCAGEAWAWGELQGGESCRGRTQKRAWKDIADV